MIMTDTENPNPNPTPPQESGTPDSLFTPAQLRVLHEMLVERAGVPAGRAAGQSRSKETCEQSEQSLDL